MTFAEARELTRQLALGEVIADRYRVLGFLGAGGMGEVYEVEHLALGRHFALKVLQRDLARDPDAIRRFTREARAMAMVESEHVVGIVDFGNTRDNSPYFVMERLRGRDLRGYLSEVGPLPIAEAANIIIEACAGLQVVHDAGLVHRDLKPGNLFLARREGDRTHCTLLDFGVVRSIAADSTQQGLCIGTVRYMAPEQILEHGVVGPKTDVYALGAILYECLTAQVPFASDAVERILFKILNGNPLPLDRIRADLPTDLCAVVLRAMARDPAMRFANATDFAKALAPHAAKLLPVGLRDSNLDRTVANAPLTDRKGPTTRYWFLLAISALLSACVIVAWQTSTRTAAPVTTSTLLQQPGIVQTPASNQGAVLTLPLASVAAPPEASNVGAVASSIPKKATAPALRSRGPTTAIPARIGLPGVDEENPYGK